MERQHVLSKRSNGVALPGISFAARASIAILGVCALFVMLYFAQPIILPLLFAAITAFLLSPVVQFLQRYHVPRILAIIIAVLLALIVTLALIYFISSQVSSFVDASPKYKERIDVLIAQSIRWVSERLHVAPEKLTVWVGKAQSEAVKNSGAILGQTVSMLGGVLMGAILVPVYVIMILWYLPLFREFLRRVVMKGDLGTVKEVLVEAESVIQNYFIGLVIEFAIVATLNSAGLLILGIDYAILLGIIGAFLNVVPFVGGMTAVALSILVALITKDSPSYAFLVLGMFVVIQFVDNHYIIPKVVASKVKLNALISIVVVLVGGAMWGIPGMFLSIPITAIAKVICDRIEPLKPWGFLLGNILPPRRTANAA